MAKERRKMPAASERLRRLAGIALAMKRGEAEMKNDEEHRKCVAYLEELWKINSLQKKESDLYDNSVVRFSNSSVTDSHVAKEM